MQNAWIEIAATVSPKSKTNQRLRLFCALLQFRYVFLEQTRSQRQRSHALAMRDTAHLVILSPACAQIRAGRDTRNIIRGGDTAARSGDFGKDQRSISAVCSIARQ
jgi:hypothetical protein